MLILASTQQNAWILDPFTGSSTTGIAANLLDRRFLGIDEEMEFLKISQARKQEIELLSVAENYKSKLFDFKNIEGNGIKESNNIYNIEAEYPTQIN